MVRNEELTSLYDMHYRLPKVSIGCPSCGKETQFFSALYCKINLRSELPYFKQSAFFDYVKVPNTGTGAWHAALFYPHLHIASLQSISDLPPHYTEEKKWTLYSTTPYCSATLGTIVCHSCDLRQKHKLAWPNDSYFQIDYKGKVLWAYNRETASVLRDFIASDTRNKNNYGHYLFLAKLPAHFLSTKARQSVVKKLDKLLKTTG